MSRTATFFKRSATWLACALLVAVPAHFLFVLLYPYAIVYLLEAHIKGKVGVNHLFHSPRPTSDSHEVVRPSPDLFYSIGTFDLGAGALQIKAAVPHNYMSLSLYAANGDNFFVVNDQQLSNDVLNILLHKDQTLSVESGAINVQAPCKQGIMLFRYFAGNAVEAGQVDRLRRQAECRVIR
jgi:uncharacterized membrane protein